jgi:hypothetical protein
MKHLAWLAGIAMAFAAPASAVPKEPVSASAELVAEVPFDPPLGEKLRYRSETTRTRDGKSRMSWSVADYQFDKANDGYRLTVFPTDRGSSEQDPIAAELEKRLGDLATRPYVIILAEDGEIKGIENEETYWSAMFDAADAIFAEEAPGGTPIRPEVRQAMLAVMKAFREMPRDARLGLMTKGVRPLVEFGNIAMTSSEPLTVQLDIVSPFGGTFTRDVRITLDQIEDDVATFTIVATIPEAELKAIVKSVFGKFGDALPAGTAEEAAAEVNKLEGFAHEERETYEVSLTDGMLIRHRATKQTEAVEAGQRHLDVEATLVERVE